VVPDLEVGDARGAGFSDLNILRIVPADRDALVQDVGEAHEVVVNRILNLFLFGIAGPDSLGERRSFCHEFLCVPAGFFCRVDVPRDRVPPLAERIGLDLQFPGSPVFYEEVVDPPDLFGIVSFL
jgi:hypothetical protein